MPRTKASPKKNVKTNIQQPTNTWLFILKGGTIEMPEESNDTLDIVNLRHPSTNESAMFLFSPVNNSIQEIQTYSADKRSWFIDQSVKSDGKMHLCTPIDPIFLVLPYLHKNCITQAIPLDTLLEDPDFPQATRLFKFCDVDKLSLVADQKGDVKLCAFKYNEEKTLSWLQMKTERVAEVLKQKNIHIGTSAVSATFVKTNSEESSAAYLKYAHGIVSEYLNNELSQKLFTRLNLPEETAVQTPSIKRVSSDIMTPPNKKVKVETLEQSPIVNLGNLSKVPKKTQLSSKEKARNKVASGSKSISSFFTKK